VFIVIPLLHFALVGIFMWCLLPLGYIPTDELAYLQIAGSVSDCLGFSWHCLPPSSGYFTKPFYQWLLGAVHHFVFAPFGYDILFSLYALNFFCLCVIGILFHLLCLHFKPGRLTHFLAPLIFYSSVTIQSVAIWPGYAPLLGLLLALSGICLYTLELKTTRVALTALVLTLAFYTHIASLPDVLGLGLAAFVTTFIFEPAKRRMKTLAFGVTAILALALIFAVNYISPYPFSPAYLDAYRESLRMNLVTHLGLEPLLFHSQILFYYLIAEAPLVLLLGFLLPTEIRKPLETRRPSQIAFFILLFFAFSFAHQSLGPQLKILRTFWLVNLPVLLFLTVALQNSTWKKWRRVLTFALFAIYIVISSLTVAEVYQTQFALRHTVDREARAGSQLFHLATEPIWGEVRVSSPWEVLYPNRLDVMPPETGDVVLAKLAPVPSVKLVELSNADEGSLSRLMKPGDFVLSGLSLKSLSLKTVQTFDLTPRRIPPTLAFEGDVTAERVVLNFIDDFPQSFLRGFLFKCESDERKWISLRQRQ
jgi:hypothetical protein